MCMVTLDVVLRHFQADLCRCPIQNCLHRDWLTIDELSSVTASVIDLFSGDLLISVRYATFLVRLFDQ